MDLSFLKEFAEEIIPNARLEDYTTFRLGGACPALIALSHPSQLENVILKLNSKNIDFILIGSGSNLLVSDQGIDRVVVRYAGGKEMKIEHADVVVSAATLLDDLVQFTIDHSLDGLAFASGIPGTVGGAIVGNAGAFGKQVGDILRSVTLMTPQGKKRTVGIEELGFSYRHSKLKETGDIVLEAVFKLTPGAKDKIYDERQRILGMRKEKHPDLQTHPCAGSFFRNIEPTSAAERRQAAGWFLEQAGAKDLSVGGAKIFEEHANIIVKGKNCRSQDVYELSQKMMDIVFEKFQLKLVREVRFVGEFKGQPKDVSAIMW